MLIDAYCSVLVFGVWLVDDQPLDAMPRPPVAASSLHRCSGICRERFRRRWLVVRAGRAAKARRFDPCCPDHVLRFVLLFALLAVGVLAKPQAMKPTLLAIPAGLEPATLCLEEGGSCDTRVPVER